MPWLECQVERDDCGGMQDTGCASWSRLGVWGRASWVKWLDMTRVCGLGNREEGSWPKPRDHVQCTQQRPDEARALYVKLRLDLACWRRHRWGCRDDSPGYTLEEEVGRKMISTKSVFNNRELHGSKGPSHICILSINRKSNSSREACQTPP